MKLRYFLIFESLAVTMLLGSLWGGVATHFSSETYAQFFRLLPIAPAIVVAILPILYFALPARFPRERS
ncbi:MAG: hypothetical protein QOF80_2092 [Verrucomicrobiota bacterium]|jgi:hypothetical protein